MPSCYSHPPPSLLQQHLQLYVRLPKFYNCHMPDTECRGAVAVSHAHGLVKSSWAGHAVSVEGLQKRGAASLGRQFCCRGALWLTVACHACSRTNVQMTGIAAVELSPCQWPMKAFLVSRVQKPPEHFLQCRVKAFVHTALCSVLWCTGCKLHPLSLRVSC